MRGGNRFELLRLGHQERRRLVRADDPRRMRIERHHHGGRCVFAGHAYETVEDLAVAAMHTVEIPEREDRLLPTRGPRIVRKVDYIHDQAGGPRTQR
jgi:hypothetical protein